MHIHRRITTRPALTDHSTDKHTNNDNSISNNNRKKDKKQGRPVCTCTYVDAHEDSECNFPWPAAEGKGRNTSCIAADLFIHNDMHINLYIWPWPAAEGTGRPTIYVYVYVCVHICICVHKYLYA